MTTEYARRDHLTRWLEAASSSPTAADAGPRTLCLLLGASFFSFCTHTRCRALGAAVAAAQAEIEARA